MKILSVWNWPPSWVEPECLCDVLQESSLGLCSSGSEAKWVQLTLQGHHAGAHNDSSRDSVEVGHKHFTRSQLTCTWPHPGYTSTRTQESAWLLICTAVGRLNNKLLKLLQSFKQSLRGEFCLESRCQRFSLPLCMIGSEAEDNEERGSAPHCSFHLIGMI